MAAAAIRYDGDFKQQTAHLDYTPDFNDALEALMHDRLATYSERILAWIKRNSWGRDSFYAVKPDGTPALQRDCVLDLGIDKRLVSKSVQYLTKRGYLLEEIKILYPAVSPRLEEKSPKVGGVGDFFTNFLPEWKVAHSTDFSELEVSRSNVVRIRRMMLSDFKKWKAARTSAAKSAAPAAAERAIKSVGTYLPTSGICRYVGTERTPGLSDRPTDQPTPISIPEPLPEPAALPKEERSPVEKEILMLPAVRALQKRFHSLPSPELLRKIVQNLQEAPLDRFNARIEHRFQTVKTLGFLQHLALDVGNAYQLELAAEKQELDQAPNEPPVVSKLPEDPASKWAQAKAVIRDRISPQEFANWIDGTRQHAFDGNTLTVWLDCVEAKMWIEREYPWIRELIAEMGIDRIEFVCGAT